MASRDWRASRSDRDRVISPSSHERRHSTRTERSGHTPTYAAADSRQSLSGPSSPISAEDRYRDLRAQSVEAQHGRYSGLRDRRVSEDGPEAERSKANTGNREQDTQEDETVKMDKDTALYTPQQSSDRANATAVQVGRADASSVPVSDDRTMTKPEPTRADQTSSKPSLAGRFDESPPELSSYSDQRIEKSGAQPESARAHEGDEKLQEEPLGPYVDEKSKDEMLATPQDSEMHSANTDVYPFALAESKEGDIKQAAKVEDVDTVPSGALLQVSDGIVAPTVASKVAVEDARELSARPNDGSLAKEEKSTSVIGATPLDAAATTEVTNLSEVSKNDSLGAAPPSLNTFAPHDEHVVTSTLVAADDSDSAAEPSSQKAALATHQTSRESPPPVSKADALLSIESTGAVKGVKRGKSNSPIPPLEKAIAPTMRQVFSRIISEKDDDHERALWKSICAQNSKLVFDCTTFERKPAFNDHLKHDERDNDFQNEDMLAKIIDYVSKQRRREGAKIDELRDQYRRLNHEWHNHCDRLDRIRDYREMQQSRPPLMASVSTPGLPLAGSTQGGASSTPSAVEEASIGILSNASMTRANRRNTQASGLAGFGDAVRSEAEFLEILASLENADMQDPSARAARTTAAEPEMIINVSGNGRSYRPYDDDNGFVINPLEFYLDDFDPDYWSEEEKIIFERRYAQHPKQFGKIAAALPHKTAQQCVTYYYSTKKLPGHNYKALLASRGRDRRRKTRVKPRKGRGSALMADLKANEVEDDQVTTPVEEQLPPRRQASGRSRMLTGLTNSTTSELDPVSEENGSADVPLARKRRADETEGDDGKRSKTRTARRGKTDKKARAVLDDLNASTDSASTEVKQALLADEQVTDAINTPASGPPEASYDAPPGPVAKKRKVPRVPQARLENESVPDVPEETVKRSRQSTSSYWSLVERNEFLHSLAMHGKEWDVIAQNLSTKSAAQARNFFVRNAEDADLIEAVTLARDLSASSLEERAAAADALVQKRAQLTQMAQDGRERDSLAHVVGTDHGEQDERESSPPPTKSGLNISSLLNSDADDGRRSTIRHWFGKAEHSDDDTEDEDRPATDLSQAHAFRPPTSRIVPPAEHMERPGYVDDREVEQHRSSDPYNRPHMSMPPPPAYLQGDYRAQRPVPSYTSMQSYPSGSHGERHTPIARVPNLERAEYPMASNARDHNGTRGQYSSGPAQHSYSRVSPAPPSPFAGREGSGERHWARAGWAPPPAPPSHSVASQSPVPRYSSWSTATGYSTTHLAPPQPPGASPSASSHQYAPGVGWRSSEGPGPYSRPSTSPMSSRMSASPSLMSASSAAGYDRPHSSGVVGEHSTSALRSVSPHPHQQARPHASSHISTTHAPPLPQLPPARHSYYPAEHPHHQQQLPRRNDMMGREYHRGAPR